MGTILRFTTKMVGASALLVAALGAMAVPTTAQEGAMPTTVSVDNRREVPVTVYLERGAIDSRIGTVPGRSRSILHLPPYLRDGETLQFAVHPEGGLDLRSREGLTARRGATLALVVPVSNVGWEPMPVETITNPGLEGPTLTVENPGNHGVVVFIERGEFDTRVGTVSAHETKTLALPASDIRDRAEVDIFVHVEGGADLASTTFEVTPKAHLVLKVPA